MTAPPVARRRLLDQPKETPVVAVIEEDLLPAVPACGDVEYAGCVMRGGLAIS
jgi:hypothetical protein